MNQFDHISMIALEHHDDLLKVADKHRMLYKAFKKDHKRNRMVQAIERAGQDQLSIGQQLIRSHVAQVDPCSPLKLQTNPGGCT
jgi:hypothetical protein